MNADCFPTGTTDWPKAVLGKALATVNPRYLVKRDAEYAFVEMASVAPNFDGVQEIGMRKFEGSGLSRFRVDDTLFAKITPCPENGKIAFVSELPTEIGIGSTEFIVLSPRQGCHPRFLYHLLCSHEVRGRAVARMEGSTGRQRVPDDVFEKRLLIPVTPLPEQIAIAHVLDAVDAGIERVRASAKQAAVVRQGLLTKLLSVGLRADGRLRDTAGEPRLFVKNGLGLTPRDWRISTVGMEFDLQTGFTLNAERRPRYLRRRYLRVANVQRDDLDLSDVQELEAADSEFLPRVLDVDDLLVVEGHADRMQIGRCALVIPEAAGMTFQNHLFRLRTKGGVRPSFGCLWLNSTFAQRYWNARCGTSSGLNTINQRMLRRLAVPVPSDPEQRAIEEIVACQRQHLEALNHQLQTLRNLKRSLMYELLSGKKRLSPDRVMSSIPA